MQTLYHRCTAGRRRRLQGVGWKRREMLFVKSILGTVRKGGGEPWSTSFQLLEPFCFWSLQMGIAGFAVRDLSHLRKYKIHRWWSPEVVESVSHLFSLSKSGATHTAQGAGERSSSGQGANAGYGQRSAANVAPVGDAHAQERRRKTEKEGRPQRWDVTQSRGGRGRRTVRRGRRPGCGCPRGAARGGSAAAARCARGRPPPRRSSARCTTCRCASRRGGRRRACGGCGWHWTGAGNGWGASRVRFPEVHGRRHT